VRSIRNWVAGYHPVVWWIIGATAVTRVTQFMVMPFIALYMSLHTHAAPSVIGLAVGMSALTGTVFGFVGGSVSDRFGRKGVMVIAMVISAGAMAGFANARTIPMFFAMSALNGLVSTLFSPASQAMMSDVTPPEKRASVYGMRYWAINVGASIGPLVGGYLGTVATGWTFYLSAGVNILYGLVILLVFPESKPDTGADRPVFRWREALRIVALDKALLIFLLATLLSNIGYAQIESTLPQLMAAMTSPQTAPHLYALVLTSNAIEVVLLQLPITRIVNGYGIIRSMMVGQGLFAAGYVLLGFATGLWSYLAAMFVLTIGEIIVFPRNNEYVAVIADDRYRATYFGAFSLRQIGFFLGPWLGGMLMESSSGLVLFAFIAVLIVIGIPLYPAAERTRISSLSRKQRGLTSEISNQI
jgi:MFS family permease